MNRQNYFYVIVLISILPTILLFFNIDFGYTNTDYTDLYKIFGGEFIHTILEWSAVIIALIAGILGIVHYMVKKDSVIPILCIALFASGSVDIFHTLAADRLITSNADNTNLIPFTWTISRIYNSIILLIGSLLLVTKINFFRNKKPDTLLIIIFSSIFILTSFFVISYCANSITLPTTTFPNQIITRPGDIIPLIIYFITGIVLLSYYKQKITITFFEYSLLVLIIPQIALQLHMVFGSTKLFDHHFNVAHFLKIITYVIPLLGVIVEYINTYNKLHSDKIKIERYKNEIVETNKKLEQFAYIASHDLQEPLRMISSYIQLIERKYYKLLDEDGKEFIGFVTDGSKRMKILIEDLLQYSRSSKKPATSNIDLNIILQVLRNETFIEHAEYITIDNQFPTVVVSETQIIQLFQNLITNALKYQPKNNIPKINIGCIELSDMWKIYVKDNGIGIKEENLKDVFLIFNRLHHDDEYSGTGLGLAVCQNIVNNFEGIICVESEYGFGSTFFFTIKK